MFAKVKKVLGRSSKGSMKLKVAATADDLNGSKLDVSQSMEGSNGDAGHQTLPRSVNSMSTNSSGSSNQSFHSAAASPDESNEIKELLEGKMQFMINIKHLNKEFRVSVDRKLPLLDLLVNIANQYHFVVADYTIVPENDGSNRYGMALKSTPVGFLNTDRLSIVPKKAANAAAASTGATARPPPSSKSQLPFKPTIRFCARLPRNQMMVFRIEPCTPFHEIKAKVCDEKSLDPSEYLLVKPFKSGQSPELIDLDKSPESYSITEVVVLSRKSYEQLLMQFTTSNENHYRSSIYIDDTASNRLSEQQQNDWSQSTPNVSMKPPDACSLASSRTSYKKKPAPPPPIATAMNGAKSVQNLSVIRDENEDSIVTSDASENGGQIRSAVPVVKSPPGIRSRLTRQNSGSDSSGYHEMLSNTETDTPTDSNSPQPPVSPNPPSDICETERPIQTENNDCNNRMLVKEAPIPCQRVSKLTSAPPAKAVKTVTSFKKRRAPPPPPVRSTSNIETSVSERVASPASCTDTSEELPSHSSLYSDVSYHGDESSSSFSSAKSPSPVIVNEPPLITEDADVKKIDDSENRATDGDSVIVSELNGAKVSAEVISKEKEPLKEKENETKEMEPTVVPIPRARTQSPQIASIPVLENESEPQESFEDVLEEPKLPVPPPPSSGTTAVEPEKISQSEQSGRKELPMKHSNVSQQQDVPKQEEKPLDTPDCNCKTPSTPSNGHKEEEDQVEPKVISTTITDLNSTATETEVVVVVQPQPQATVDVHVDGYGDDEDMNRKAGLVTIAEWGKTSSTNDVRDHEQQAPQTITTAGGGTAVAPKNSANNLDKQVEVTLKELNETLDQCARDSLPLTSPTGTMNDQKQKRPPLSLADKLETSTVPAKEEETKVIIKPTMQNGTADVTGNNKVTSQNSFSVRDGIRKFNTVNERSVSPQELSSLRLTTANTAGTVRRSNSRLLADEDPQKMVTKKLPNFQIGTFKGDTGVDIYETSKNRSPPPTAANKQYNYRTTVNISVSQPPAPPAQTIVSSSKKSSPQPVQPIRDEIVVHNENKQPKHEEAMEKIITTNDKSSPTIVSSKQNHNSSNNVANGGLKTVTMGRNKSPNRIVPVAPGTTFLQELKHKSKTWSSRNVPDYKELFQQQEEEIRSCIRHDDDDDADVSPPPPLPETSPPSSAEKLNQRKRSALFERTARVYNLDDVNDNYGDKKYVDPIPDYPSQNHVDYHTPEAKIKMNGYAKTKTSPAPPPPPPPPPESFIPPPPPPPPPSAGLKQTNKLLAPQGWKGSSTGGNKPIRAPTTTRSISMDPKLQPASGNDSRDALLNEIKNFQHNSQLRKVSTNKPFSLKMN